MWYEVFYVIVSMSVIHFEKYITGKASYGRHGTTRVSQSGGLLGSTRQSYLHVLKHAMQLADLGLVIDYKWFVYCSILCNRFFCVVVLLVYNSQQINSYNCQTW